MTPLVIIAAATGLALLSATQVWLDYAYAGHMIAFPRATAVAFAQWYLWAAAAPAIAWLARRVRIDRRHWMRALAVHAPVSLVCTVVKGIVDTRAAARLTGVARGPVSFMQVYLTLLTYWVIVGATYTLEQAQRARERQVRAAELEADLARAQVQALRVQIQPHFLFNTLNSIAALMREDVEAADAMIARLAELLRATLATADATHVPLARELELAQMYLAIQQARIGERLSTNVSADESCLAVPVPTLVLQPLVENAIRHGAAARMGPATIAVRARRAGARLIVEIEDDGPGVPAEVREGLGLANTRARLRASYGNDGTLDLTRGSGGGTLVRLGIPA